MEPLPADEGSQERFLGLTRRKRISVLPRYLLNYDLGGDSRGGAVTRFVPWLHHRTRDEDYPAWSSNGEKQFCLCDPTPRRPPGDLNEEVSEEGWEKAVRLVDAAPKRNFDDEIGSFVTPPSHPWCPESLMRVSQQPSGSRAATFSLRQWWLPRSPPQPRQHCEISALSRRWKLVAFSPPRRPQ